MKHFLILTLTALLSFQANAAYNPNAIDQLIGDVSATVDGLSSDGFCIDSNALLITVGNQIKFNWIADCTY